MTRDTSKELSVVTQPLPSSRANVARLLFTFYPNSEDFGTSILGRAFFCALRDQAFRPFLLGAGADVGVVLVPLWLCLSNQHVHMGHMPSTVYWNSTGDLKDL